MFNRIFTRRLFWLSGFPASVPHHLPGPNTSLLYIEQRDCSTSGLHARGIYERFPIQKLIRYTPATQAGLYLLYALTPQPEACLKLFNKNLKFIRVLYGVLEYLPSLFNSGYVKLARQDSGFESGIPHSDPRT